MENSGTPVNTVEQQTGFEKVKAVIGKINRVINTVGVWLFRLRKFVMAAPVVYYALKLAAYNREHLPELVGINLQSSGEFAQYISRNMAVMGPLALTIGCLILMFCSRKAMDSWATSILTLSLPLLLLVGNARPTSRLL